LQEHVEKKDLGWTEGKEMIINQSVTFWGTVSLGALGPKH